MTSLKRSGGFTLPPAAHDLTGPLFASASISDADVSIEIRDVFKKNRYVADPHTAVGLVAARRCATFSKNNSKTVSVCLATASPGKFPQAVLEAINGKRSSSSKNAIIQFKDFAPKPLLDVQGLPRRCLIVPMRQNFIEEGVQGVRRAIESRASATVLKKYSKL